MSSTGDAVGDGRVSKSTYQAKSADLIVVVVATGQDHVHWNSADNLPWDSDDPTILPTVYNDQVVKVVGALKRTPGAVLTVRNIGGRVGDIEFVYEGLEPLARDEAYPPLSGASRDPDARGTEVA